MNSYKKGAPVLSSPFSSWESRASPWRFKWSRFTWPLLTPNDAFFIFIPFTWFHVYTFKKWAKLWSPAWKILLASLILNPSTVDNSNGECVCSVVSACHAHILLHCPWLTLWGKENDACSLKALLNQRPMSYMTRFARCLWVHIEFTWNAISTSQELEINVTVGTQWSWTPNS